MPPRETLPPDPANSAGPTRREWIHLLLIVLTGLVIRGVAADRMSVEHFDEGVYASNIWFGAKQGYRYPARHLYAPPFVPWMAEWSQILFGRTHWGTMLPGVLSGTLTIIASWWCVRCWFGSTAGLVAATLAAFSNYHVIYSRAVLTEPVLCLLLLIAVFLIWRALVENDFRWAVAAGLCTGLAWITKYNGWLPLAIGVAGLSAWSILPPRRESRGRRFLVLGVIACCALPVVFPVWWDLQQDGGYQVVQENHARYIVGVSGWISSWKRQLDNHQFIDGPLSWLGIFVAVSIAGFGSQSDHQETNAGPNSRFRSLAWTISCAGISLALAKWVGTSVVLGALGVGWLLLACPVWSNRGDRNSSPRNLAYWLVAAWFIGLFLVTPLYTPYPRLSLPWLVAGWISAAAMLGSTPIQKLLAGKFDWQSKPSGKVALVIVAIGGILGVGGQIAMGVGGMSPWQNRAGLERVATQITDLVSRKHDGRAVVYVYAEPGLFYQLKSKGISAGPVADLQFSAHRSPIPVILVVGPHAQRSPAFQKEWKMAQTRFELVESFPYIPSELVLLNHYSPEDIDDPDFQREQTIRLYLTTPP